LGYSHFLPGPISGCECGDGSYSVSLELALVVQSMNLSVLAPSG
jgi:hypothetical protein